MATRESTESGRKKLTTYGKTSRKTSKPAFSVSTASDHAQAGARHRTEPANRPNTAALPRAVASDNGNIIRPVNRRKTPPAESPTIAPNRTAFDDLTSTPPQSSGNNKAPKSTPKVAPPARPLGSSSRKADAPTKSSLPPKRSSRTGQETEATSNARVRLIDRLAAQAVESTELESEHASQVSDSPEGPSGQPLMTGDGKGTTPSKAHDEPPRMGAQRTTPNSRKRKVKATYGQQRTMRAAVDTMRDNKEDSISSYLGGGDRNASPPAKYMKMDLYAQEDDPIEEDIQTTKNGILSLHALRQAGANHRLADELSDLAERIGVPRSTQSVPARSRRGALLELGGKLHDEKFVGRLCDYGAKETFFLDVGSEMDMINSFVLLSTVLVLVGSLTAPHLVEQLEANGVVKVLSTMLSSNDDITEIARQDTVSHSPRGLAALGSLRATILHLEVWDGPAPAKLSPKTLALKVLCICHKSSAAETRRNLVEPVVPQLFAVIGQSDSQFSTATEDTRAHINMALFLLQEHSIFAMQSKERDRWTSEYLPSVASLLSDTLLLSGEGAREARQLTLRLAMNTTNNNPASASVFGQGHLVRKLATVSLARFEELHTSVKRGEFPADLHSTLLLLLGLLINISEHCPSTRQSLADEFDYEVSPLDGLIAVWLENRESCGHAETVEQSSLAVTYGYLAILLGHLCLGSRVRRRLATQSNNQGLSYLLDSIQEFMTLHTRAAGDELAATLQTLVNELRLLMKTG